MGVLFKVAGQCARIASPCRGLWRLNRMPTLLPCTLLLALCVSSIQGMAASPRVTPRDIAVEASLAINTPGESATSEASSSSKDAPLPEEPQAQAPPRSLTQDVQTKRILGIIPNFRAVSTDAHLPPQSVREKFVTTTQDSFDYTSIVLPAVLAAYSEGVNSTPEFGKGGVGYGRYLWHNVVDQTSENYWVEFIVPAITHEDTRYYTLGRGSFLKRTGYSLSRVVVTRNDAGTNTFNAGEVVGAGIASGISVFYYPSKERSFGSVGSKWGQNIGVDAATFVFKEYWPDINHHLFHFRKNTP